MEENNTTTTFATDTAPIGQQSASVTGESRQDKNPLDTLLTADKTARAEFDRRISKSISTALENERGKWEKDAAARIQAERSEAEKLAHMNAEQRAAHEHEKREADYQRRMRELTQRELKAQAAGELRGRGLPQSLLGALNYQDADACMASMDDVEAAFREALKEGVKDRVRGTPPKAATGGKADHLAEFRKAAGLTG